LAPQASSTAFKNKKKECSKQENEQNGRKGDCVIAANQTGKGLNQTFSFFPDTKGLTTAA
jgi:hypothetical protein